MNGNSVKINELLKRLNSRQKKLLMILAMVFIAVIAVEISFGLFISRSQELKTENASLRSKLTDYTMLVNQERSIIDEINSLNDDAKNIIDKYSAGNTPEKTLVFLDKLSKSSGMSIPSVSFGQETLISAGADVAATQALQGNDKTEDDSNEGGNINIIEGGSDLYLYNYPVTFSYAVSYSGLKQALNYIESNEERMTVENISVSYDAGTGYVSGSITLNQYTLTGIGVERSYRAPEINGKEKGVSNLFG